MSGNGQGQVYWLDFGPATGSAPRTSNLSRVNAPGNVLLTKGEANLPKASVVNVP